MTIASLLASIPLQKRNDAIWLLMSIFSLTRSDILLNSSREVSASECKKWKKSWKRRLAGEPLQYIAGSAPFWGREFFVNRDVLIPRPETERLVELALSLLKERKDPKIIDVGTGSGAIAITLKLERPDAQIFASDISAPALRVARKNAKKNSAEIFFLKRDVLMGGGFPESVDLIVSNPPYLDFLKDKVTREVLNWEPKIALQPAKARKGVVVNDRGAWMAEALLQGCVKLRPEYSAFELSPRVALLLERRWKKNIAVARIWREADLAGRKRFLLIAWNHA